VSMSGGFGCLLLQSGQVQCWGDDDHGELGSILTSPCPNSNNRSAICTATPLVVPGVSDAVAIAAGGDFACALLASGAVDCWGFSSMGELGTAVALGAESGPVVVATGASAIAAGEQSACARVSGGAWKCWGANLRDLDASGNPVAAPGGWNPGVDGAVEVELGYLFGCARWTDGSVRCFGVLPDPSRSGPNSAVPPTIVATLPAVNQVAATVFDTCGVTTTGQVACWGGNQFGQLGIADELMTAPPTTVPGVDGAVQVSCSEKFTCVLLGDGSVRCWGLDNVLVSPACTNSPNPTCTAPAPVPGIAHAVQLSVNVAGSCAVMADGSLGCWGLSM
jgi:alpha-tubulin suppressor-like RCC1 family protein